MIWTSIASSRLPSLAQTRFDPDDTGVYKKNDAGKARPKRRRQTKFIAQLDQAAGTPLRQQDASVAPVILKAWTRAGRTATIKHVMSGVNPQGCRVASLKRREKNSNRIFWRIHQEVPPKGTSEFSNRSQ